MRLSDFQAVHQATLDNVQHHVVNAAAVGAPVASFFANAPATLTAILTTMGILWYMLLFIKEFLAWRARRKNKPQK